MTPFAALFCGGPVRHAGGQCAPHHGLLQHRPAGPAAGKLAARMLERAHLQIGWRRCIVQCCLRVMLCDAPRACCCWRAASGSVQRAMPAQLLISLATSLRLHCRGPCMSTAGLIMFVPMGCIPILAAGSGLRAVVLSSWRWRHQAVAPIGGPSFYCLQATCPS